MKKKKKKKALNAKKQRVHQDPETRRDTRFHFFLNHSNDFSEKDEFILQLQEKNLDQKDSLLSLNQKYERLNQKYIQLRQEHTRLRTELSRFNTTQITTTQRIEASRAQKEKQKSPVLSVLDTALIQRGIPRELHPEIIFELAKKHPIRWTQKALWKPNPLQKMLKQIIVLSCLHQDCPQKQSTNEKIIVLVQNPALCENCQGSTNRRIWKKMVRVCQAKKINRLLIVGGSPDTHAEIDILTPSHFDVCLIDGKKRRTKQQAAEDLRKADIIIIWGSTILPHSVSILYTKSREHKEKILPISKRGISSLAEQVTTFVNKF